ncbi:MAG: phosphoribosylaminoimidazolesuccinocarboxamide synthase [Anaerolineae bacterium]|jgi:phosphoribosylaminoimidazole-succinocarboxamide synthase
MTHITAFGEQLADGKTKTVFAHPTRQDLVYLVHKDRITAGDGARANELPGKGALACRTTSNVFYYLEQEGIDTHYIGMVEPAVNLVVRCEMIPLEVVMRRIATGSYLKRNPEAWEGQRFDPPLVEFFYKSDALHDPLVDDAEILRMGLVPQTDVDAMRDTGRQVFRALEKAWAAQRITLVDLKIEFGRDTQGALMVADVVDNDSWRLWPGGDKNRMLDKQVYRDMSSVTDAGLRALMLKYAQVAELTDRFVEED